MPEELYTQKEYESILLKAFGNSPKLRIIDFFLDNPLFDFTKKEVIEALGMSKQTFYKYFEDLKDLAVVEITRKIGRAELYKINLENPMVKLVREYETELSTEMAEQEKVKRQKPASAVKS